MAVQQLCINSLSNPADQKKLLSLLKTCSDSLTRMEAEKELIKAEIAEISEQLEIPKRLLNKLVRVYHKQNYDEEVTTNEQFVQLYETVVK